MYCAYEYKKEETKTISEIPCGTVFRYHFGTLPYVKIKDQIYSCGYAWVNLATGEISWEVNDPEIVVLKAVRVDDAGKVIFEDA